MASEIPFLHGIAPTGKPVEWTHHHSFRLVNADGDSHFVKFHWRPMLGTHSLDWDEAVKIAAADPDFHRRDLWEAIEAGERAPAPVTAEFRPGV